MKCSTASWTVTVAAAALLALPGAAAAQTPPATQPPTTAQPQPPADPAKAAPAATPAAAQEHLRQAKAALDDVGTANLNARARTQVAELKKRLNALERSIAANDSASAPGAANRSASATRGARGNVNWGTEVAAMDKTLTALLGPATGTTGTTGTTPPAENKASTAVTLDDATRAKLTEFRTHITGFAAAMAGQPAPGGDPAASATPPSATPPTDPAPTTPPAQPTATPPAAPSAEAAPKADQEATKRHLTEARNTLTQLTQLPASAQLSGEARTQVAQLISNFNELITTQTEWKAAYAKVAANMTALLGPDTGTTEPAAASATAGAVGTSGSGMSLDPAVRAKLVEMRKQLADFERAAGGAAAVKSAPASAAAPTTSPKAAEAPPTPPPAAAAAPPPAASAAATVTTPTAQPASSDPLSHVVTIEAILKSQNESGGLTLDKAQVELLRTHIAELRKLLEKK